MSKRRHGDDDDEGKSSQLSPAAPKRRRSGKPPAAAAAPPVVASPPAVLPDDAFHTTILGSLRRLTTFLQEAAKSHQVVFDPSEVAWIKTAEDALKSQELHNVLVAYIGLGFGLRVEDSGSGSWDTWTFPQLLYTAVCLGQTRTAVPRLLGVALRVMDAVPASGAPCALSSFQALRLSMTGPPPLLNNSPYVLHALAVHHLHKRLSPARKQAVRYLGTFASAEDLAVKGGAVAADVAAVQNVTDVAFLVRAPGRWTAGHVVLGGGGRNPVVTRYDPLSTGPASVPDDHINAFKIVAERLAVPEDRRRTPGEVKVDLPLHLITLPLRSLFALAMMLERLTSERAEPAGFVAGEHTDVIRNLPLLASTSSLEAQEWTKHLHAFQAGDDPLLQAGPRTNWTYPKSKYNIKEVDIVDSEVRDHTAKGKTHIPNYMRLFTNGLAAIVAEAAPEVDMTRTLPCLRVHGDGIILEDAQTSLEWSASLPWFLNTIGKTRVVPKQALYDAVRKQQLETVTVTHRSSEWLVLVKDETFPPVAARANDPKLCVQVTSVDTRKILAFADEGGGAPAAAPAVPAPAPPVLAPPSAGSVASSSSSSSAAARTGWVPAESQPFPQQTSSSSSSSSPAAAPPSAGSVASSSSASSAAARTGWVRAASQPFLSSSSSAAAAPPSAGSVALPFESVLHVIMHVKNALPGTAWHSFDAGALRPFACADPAMSDDEVVTMLEVWKCVKPFAQDAEAPSPHGDDGLRVSRNGILRLRSVYWFDRVLFFDPEEAGLRTQRCAPPQVRDVLLRLARNYK